MRWGGLTQRSMSDGLLAVALVLGLLFGGVAYGNPDSISEAESRCDAGDGDFCAKIGNYYLLGTKGYSRNPKMAARYHYQACREGTMASCALATGKLQSHLDASHAADDLPSLFHRRCTDGDEMACSKVGFFYEHGWGVDQDLEYALRLYASACDTGGFLACLRAAALYETGAKVDKDLALAISFHRKGCRILGTTQCPRADQLEKDLTR